MMRLRKAEAWMRPYVKLSSVFALAACVASFTACSGDGGSGAEPVDTGVETEADTSTGDLGVETSDDTGSPDTGSPDTADTTVVDSGSEVADDTGVDSGVDTADTFVADTTPEDTADTAVPEDTTPADTTPVDTATCTIGGACDDGNACTTGETYNSSCVCTGGTAVSCDDSNVCTTDTCNTTSGCVHTATGEGTSCGAGKKCTSGICADFCTPGNTCSDSNACTTGEKFDDTCACTGGTAVSCDDANECTTDSCSTTTGCAHVNVTDGTACGGSGSGKTCKAGVCTLVVPPTVTITGPADGYTKQFTVSDTCQWIPFTVSYTAPAGFKAMQWVFIPPTGGTGTNVQGSGCGLPFVYNYYMDATTYAGQTSGSFNEDVSIAGNYTGPAGSGRWYWCTAPASTSPATSVVSMTAPAYTAPPVPGTGTTATLSDWCFFKKGGGGTAPTAGSAGNYWTFKVELIDNNGTKVTATKQFAIYQ